MTSRADGWYAVRAPSGYVAHYFQLRGAAVNRFGFLIALCGFVGLRALSGGLAGVECSSCRHAYETRGPR